MATSRTALAFRLFVNELWMLTGGLPNLRDAFDVDELPLAFIIWRDALAVEHRTAAPRQIAAARPIAAARQIVR